MVDARDGKNIVDIIYVGQDANYWVPALNRGFNLLNVKAFGTPFAPALMSTSFDVVSNVAHLSTDWSAESNARSSEVGTLKMFKGGSLFAGDAIHEAMHTSVTPYGKALEWGYVPKVDSEYFIEYASGIYISNGPPSLGIPIDSVSKLEYRVLRVSGYTGSYSMSVDTYDASRNYTVLPVVSNQSSDLIWVSDSLQFMYSPLVHGVEGLRFACTGSENLGLTSGISGDFGIGLHSLHKNEISGFAITPFHTYGQATFESLNSDLNRPETIFTLETYLNAINERSVSAYSKLPGAEGGSGRMVFFIQANSSSESTMINDIISIKDKITATCLGLGFDENNFTFAIMIPAPISEFDLEFVSLRQSIADAILAQSSSIANISFINIPAIFSYTQMIENGWATIAITPVEENPTSQFALLTGGQCCETYTNCCPSVPVCTGGTCTYVRCWNCSEDAPGFGVCGVVMSTDPDTGGSSSDTSAGGSSSSSSSEKNPFI